MTSFNLKRGAQKNDQIPSSGFESKLDPDHPKWSHKFSAMAISCGNNQPANPNKSDANPWGFSNKMH
jgi:hypothetical protein